MSRTIVNEIREYCFRNRLESNAEHWNALLLSLQELIEWVIRKDTELTGLGPMGGDTISLQKQLVRQALSNAINLTIQLMRRDANCLRHSTHT